MTWSRDGRYAFGLSAVHQPVCAAEGAMASEILGKAPYAT